MSIQQIQLPDTDVSRIKEWWKKFVDAGLADHFIDVYASVDDYDSEHEYIIHATSNDYYHRCGGTVIHTGICEYINEHVELRHEGKDL